MPGGCARPFMGIRLWASASASMRISRARMPHSRYRSGTPRRSNPSPSMFRACEALMMIVVPDGSQAPDSSGRVSRATFSWPRLPPHRLHASKTVLPRSQGQQGRTDHVTCDSAAASINNFIFCLQKYFSTTETRVKPECRPFTLQVSTARASAASILAQRFHGPPLPEKTGRSKRQRWYWTPLKMGRLLFRQFLLSSRSA